MRVTPAPRSIRVGNRSVMRLAPRGYQCLACSAHGMSSKEIGAHLGVTEHAVKVYLAKAYAALGVTSREEAYIALGWLIPPAIPEPLTGERTPASASTADHGADSGVVAGAARTSSGAPR